MTDDIACSITSAYILTRIFTFILYACQVRRAIWINNAFRTASFIRISNMIWEAHTCASVSVLFAYGIWTTWRWWTRGKRNIQNLTFSEGIPSVSWRAQALRWMTDHPALGSRSARTRTGISTFLIYTSHFIRTFRIRYAFWPTVWRISHIINLTSTRWWTAYFFAYRVRPTGWRFTRIDIRWWLNICNS